MAVRTLAGLLFILSGFIQMVCSANGPLCLGCKNIPFPRDCDRIVECNAFQKCSTTGFVTDSANLLYNVGCSSACVVKRSRDQSDTTVCSSCCDGDYCNRDLCPTGNPPDTGNRTYCLKCDDVLNPSQCEKTVLCEPGEICYTELVNRNGESRYRMGCVSESSCSAPQNAKFPTPLIGRKRFLINDRSETYCNRCCKDKIGTSGNCNRKLCNDQEPVPPYINELILVAPPLRTDSCLDLTEQRCQSLVLNDTTVCTDPSIANFACRKTCGTCVGTISPGASTLPDTDCFYDSRRYQGSYETTMTGTRCIEWSSVFLRDDMGLMFPEKSVQGAGNKCRDPDGRGHPWCFTSTNDNWGYCNVPFCEQCYYTNQSQIYNGYKDTDANGNKCNSWALSSPGSLDDRFVDGSAAAAKNFCRNPYYSINQTAGTGIQEPLCYTALGLKSCGIKQCTEACQDDPSTNCSLVKDYVCQNDYNSLTLCAKTCRKCKFGLLPGKVIQPPIDFCKDNPAANCQALQSFICPDDDGARRLCPRTCRRCNDINVTTQTTQASVVTTKGPAAQWSEWGPYDCTIKSNTCFMTRIRNCSVKAACGPESLSSDAIKLCTKVHCPDEIKQLNMIQATVPTTTPSTPLPTTVSSCQDSGEYDCSAVKDLVCGDESLKYSCNKTCYVCGCDDIIQRCSGEFCADEHLAITYCKRTCNKCASPNVNVTYNSCNDPVSTDDQCNLLQIEIGICHDPELVQLCTNYCAGRCGQPVATYQFGGKRSVQMKMEIVKRVLNRRRVY